MLESLKLGLRLYNGILALMYFCGVLFMILLIVSGLSNTRLDPTEAAFMIFFVVIGLVVLLVFLGFHAYLLVAAGKRSKTNYILQIVSIALSLGSVITIVPGVLLLIGLLSDEARDYYWRK